jgi:Tfp pilus assembly protein PilF
VKPAGPSLWTALVLAVVVSRSAAAQDANLLLTEGLRAYQGLDFDAAAQLLRRALEIDPANGRALAYLALVLLDRDRAEEAETAGRSALALRPEDPDVLNAMGRVLARQDRPEEALALFRRALALVPDFADAHNNMGIVLVELGELAAARDALRKAVTLDPRHAGAYMNLAEALRFEPGDPHLAAMESLARDAKSLTETQQMHLHFALGKALSDVGDAARSIRHMLEGNRLKRSHVAYDEASVLGAFDRIRRTFTPSLLAEKAGHGDPSPLPIFILGMPRSGTTLVEQILASHPLVHGAGELEDFARIVESLRHSIGAFPESAAALGARESRAIAERYLEGLRARAGASERVTDKMPSNFYFVGLIHLALPGASIVHVRRDPVDTCLSCFSKLFASPQDHTYDLAELGRYYRKYAELMAHWRAVLPPGRMLEVRYEELVADFEPEARRIVAHCGLDWDEACRQFHRTARPVRTASASQVRQPIYGSAVGRGSVRREFLAPLMRELGPLAAEL